MPGFQAARLTDFERQPDCRLLRALDVLLFVFGSRTFCHLFKPRKCGRFGVFLNKLRFRKRGSHAYRRDGCASTRHRVSCLLSFCRCLVVALSRHCITRHDLPATGVYQATTNRHFRNTRQAGIAILIEPNFFFLKKTVAFEWICTRISNYWNFRELSNSQFHPPELPSGFKGLNHDSP